MLTPTKEQDGFGKLRSVHARHNRRVALILRALTLAGILLLPASSDAQVVTNITSSGLNTAVAQAGTTYNITGGTRPGNLANLFHSFGLFNVGAGDTANFSNETGLATTNILGRVNGGQLSNIFGRIQTSGFGAANLFLINPAGWLFGAGSSLNVAGSFHASTADYVRFPDVAGAQVRFNADNSALPADGLTVNPIAFGFLSANPVRIAVEGGTLQVAAGKTLALVGGEAAFAGQVETGLKIAGGGAASATSTLRASGATGQIQIVSVGSVGEMILGANPDVSSFANLGQIKLTNGSNVANVGVLDVSGNPAGSVVIRGGRLVADQSAKIFARNTGAVVAAPTAVDIQVTGDLTLGGGSAIEVRASGAGAAGETKLTAANLEVKEASFIQSITTNAGAGGKITANVQTAAIKSGASIATRSDRILVPASAGGLGGNVTLNATGSVLIDGANSTLNSTTNSNRAGGVGIGGNLTVNASSLTISNGGSMNTVSTSTGAGGNMLVQVADLNLASTGNMFSRTVTAQGGSLTIATTGSTVTISGAGSGVFSGSSSTGTAGAVSVNTTRLTIDGGQIGSGTRAGDPQGGSLTVAATESIDILNGGAIRSRAFSQPVAPVTITTPSLTINGGSLDTSTSQNGNAGNILVNGGSSGTVALINGGQIASNSALSASGSGGSVIVNTGTLTISGSSANRLPVTNLNNDPHSGIFSTAQGSGNAGQINLTAPTLTMNNGGTISVVTSGTGNAGSVLLNVNNLSLAGGSPVTSSTTGSGNGGTVGVAATELVSISGTGSGLFSTASSTGNAGEISVTTPTLTMADGGKISVATSGSGNAGNISLNVTNFTQTSGATVDSSTSAAGHGGNLTVTAANSATISDPGSGLSSTASGTGAGGNIGLQAENIGLLNSGTITTNSTGSATASAGDVNIVFGDTLRMVDSSITTAATLADGGNISITATGSNLLMTNGNIITSVASGFGSGGNITIGSPGNPFDFVILNNSQIRADAFGGPGGNININADVYLTSNSVVSASSQLSAPGIIAIEASFTDVSGSVAQLPETPLKATDLLRASCAARFAGGKLSSLVLSGRDGLPIQPGGVLPSPLYLASNAAASAAGVGSLTQGSTARFSLLSAGSKDRPLTQYSLLPNAKCAF